MFVYCLNNPVRYVDVAGFLAQDAIDLGEDENKILDPDASGASNSTALQTYYPPNGGFSGTPQQTTLSVGTQLQRTGSLDGAYVAPAGTPNDMLSLPHNQIGQSTVYLEVAKPINVMSGTVAPWFGKMGGGIQYVLLDGSIRSFIVSGHLKLI